MRETNAHLEANEPWKAEPGPEVDAVLGDALEALRIVSILASARRCPTACAEIWRRIGLPGRPDEQRLPDAGAWGGYPGGLPVEKGDPALPPDHGRSYLGPAPRVRSKKVSISSARRTRWNGEPPAGQLVALAGEPPVLDVGVAEQPQGREEGVGLLGVAPEVLLGVEDEDRAR